MKIKILICFFTVFVFKICGQKSDLGNSLLHVEKIEFLAHGCFGTCPQMSLYIKKNRKARLELGRLYREQGLYGFYFCTLNKSNFDELIQCLNDIDLTNLQDKYADDSTDSQFIFLKITYNHGKIKSIKDYGARGTTVLTKLYRLLYDLRENQKWVKKCLFNIFFKRNW